MLRVNEIFVSLQGETSLVGLPCIFVRLTGCNLRCRYCDTTYAYHQGSPLSLDHLLGTIATSSYQRVVITGGEPLVQSETIPLMENLVRTGKCVILETNGSRSIRHVPRAVIRVIDLKVPSSGETAAMKWDNLEALRTTDQLKFVLSNKRDFNWARRVIETYDLQSRVNELLFSPVQGRLSRKKLASWILESGLDARLQIQLHKVIWGPSVRGV